MINPTQVRDFISKAREFRHELFLEKDLDTQEWVLQCHNCRYKVKEVDVPFVRVVALCGTIQLRESHPKVKKVPPCNYKCPAHNTATALTVYEEGGIDPADIPCETLPPLDEIHPKFKKDDPVNHPAHYTQHPSGVECIQITEHMNFNIGNAVKYLWKADLKNGLQDLEKAAWYIQREIARRSK